MGMVPGLGDRAHERHEAFQRAQHRARHHRCRDAGQDHGERAAGEQGPKKGLVERGEGAGERVQEHDGDRKPRLVRIQRQGRRDILVPAYRQDERSGTGGLRNRDGGARRQRGLQRRPEDAGSRGHDDVAVERFTQPRDVGPVDPVAQRQRADDVPLQQDRDAADLEVPIAEAHDGEVLRADRRILRQRPAKNWPGRLSSRCSSITSSRPGRRTPGPSPRCP